MNKTTAQPPASRAPPCLRRLHMQAVKFLAGVVIAVAVACILATELPQGAEAAGYLKRGSAMARWFDISGRLGFPDIFAAWWFIGLLALLSAAVAGACVRRISTIRRATDFASVFGSMLMHISVLLILAGGIARGIWGQTGYMKLREGETKNEFLIENRARPLPFALHLSEFAVEREKISATADNAPRLEHELLVQWPARKLSARVPVRLNVSHSLTPQGEGPSAANTFYVRVLQYVPDFAMNSETREVFNRSDEPNNPAVLVEVKNEAYHNNCWFFARHPDFTVHVPGHEPSGPSPLRIFYRIESHNEPVAALGPLKSFSTSVRVLAKGKPVREAAIELNRPFTHGGYTFFQTGYDPKDLTWTSFEVVRDPGLLLVYAGFALLVTGLFTVFYLNPWLNERRKEKCRTSASLETSKPSEANGVSIPAADDAKEAA